MIHDAIRKGRSMPTSKSNVLQAPHYDQDYGVDIAAYGYTITKLSLQTDNNSAYVTLAHNGRAIAAAQNLLVSDSLLQVDLAEAVAANDTITLRIMEQPPSTGYNPPGYLPSETEPKTPKPPPIPNLSYTLWLSA